MDITASDPTLAGTPLDSNNATARHFPCRSVGKQVLPPYSHFIRSKAKELAQSEDPKVRAEFRLDDLARCRHRRVIEQELKCELPRYSRNHPYRYCRAPVAGDRCAARTSFTSEVDEGQDLARSDVPLPSDGFRLGRRPTLGREDAFRDASTSKGKIRTRRAIPLSDDAQVAQLYSIGLLYDDDKDKVAGGDNIDLNNIRHDQPLFAIHPAKRVRRSNRSRSSKGPNPELPLHLNLSFTDLGEDNAIAQYLASPPLTEISSDEAIQHTPRHSPQSLPRMRVIYELAGLPPSFDVDTSQQPPDLVLDTLSDYDYCSDNELDDTPSQREIQDGADHWVMLSDGS